MKSLSSVHSTHDLTLHNKKKHNDREQPLTAPHHLTDLWNLSSEEFTFQRKCLTEFSHMPSFLIADISLVKKGSLKKLPKFPQKMSSDEVLLGLKRLFDLFYTQKWSAECHAWLMWCMIHPNRTMKKNEKKSESWRGKPCCNKKIK